MVAHGLYELVANTPDIVNSTRDRSCMFCLQWKNLSMGPNEQNQHFTVLRQSMYIHTVVNVP